MSQLTAEEQKTINAYVQIAKDWSKNHEGMDFWGEELERFRRYLPSGKILEIGCGGGRDAELLLSTGYDYLGTDVIEEFLEIARENNPNAVFRRASIYDLDFDKKFDGFWCAAVLLHIPKTKIQTALQAIKRNIKPGGIGFICVKRGEGERVERNAVYEGERLFAYWQVDELSKQLEKAGLEVLETGSKIHGKNEWLTFIVRVK